MNATAVVTPAACAAALARLRAATPIVQCLTNVVVTQWTANVLLAIGAAPAMVDNPEEAGHFASIADGVLVNLGTPYADTAAATLAAVEAAADAGTPLVLDPVAAGVLPWRTELAGTIAETGGPAIVRGNASEIIAMVGGAGGRGVDAVDPPDAALTAARHLASRHGTVVAVSGEIDHVTDSECLVRIANGDPLLTRVTGTGCALGAMMAAFAAVTDPMTAAVAATATLTVAADAAAVGSAGPGSFAVALLDHLATIEPAVLATRTRLS